MKIHPVCAYRSCWSFFYAEVTWHFLSPLRDKGEERGEDLEKSDNDKKIN